MKSSRIAYYPRYCRIETTLVGLNYLSSNKYISRSYTGSLRLQQPNQLLPHYYYRYKYSYIDAVYILKAEIQGRYSNYNLVDYSPSYYPLTRPSRQLVSGDNTSAGNYTIIQADEEAINNIAAELSRDVISIFNKISRPDLVAAVC